MVNQNRTRELLAKFESLSWLARKLGLSPHGVGHWPRRSPYIIPCKYWAEILEIAEAENIDLTADDLIQHARRK